MLNLVVGLKTRTTIIIVDVSGEVKVERRSSNSVSSSYPLDYQLIYSIL